MRTQVPSLSNFARQQARTERPTAASALLTPTTGPIQQHTTREAAPEPGLVDIAANEITEEHVGDDITFSVSGTPVGGKLEALGSVFGLTAVKVDGVSFLLDNTVTVQVRETNIREKILTISDPGRRAQLIHQMYLRKGGAAGDGE
ncbi:hypothetical protein [Agromyces humi]|uniref:hypothetical protein n=1 Tax=Agromyces humi TaxID=1766800 RepID=UPI00135774E1|nr:hypothetical protein [Agromyces humi]